MLGAPAALPGILIRNAGRAGKRAGNLDR